MWFFALLVVLLVGAVAVVASGRWGAMGRSYDDRPDTLVPARHALTAADIESSRFAIGVRGYRMDEVDMLLERVAREVAERDRRIADLERAVTPIVRGSQGDGFGRPDRDEHEQGETAPAGNARGDEPHGGPVPAGQGATERTEPEPGQPGQERPEPGQPGQGTPEPGQPAQGRPEPGQPEQGASRPETDGPSQMPVTDDSGVRPRSR